jgi:CRISPR/Cas system endoribonuclease Cas6 (RAMP superfamily)
MQIDGVMGEMKIKGIDMKSYRYLKLGEIIGVGKLTTFGLGKIKIRNNEDSFT